MKQLNVLQSDQDASVNFVEQHLAGFLESRYVRRVPERFVCYLSSHDGCNRGCAMCHLTVTGQTSFRATTIDEYVAQAARVFNHYLTQPPARYCHFAFMARGEPLANPHLLNHGDQVLVELGRLAKYHGLPAKFAISTIMPKTLSKDLVDVFSFTSPTIYYSLYSVRDDFRTRWLPHAMPVTEALKCLRAWQVHSKKAVKIHHALIAGQNDSPSDAEGVVRAVDDAKLRCEFNLVCYNPASPSQGEEAGEQVIAEYLEVLREGLGRDAVKTIERVGFDVKASCGMFVK